MPTEPLTILVDMDGIISALHKKWLDTYNAEHGTSFCVGDITTWDTHTALKCAPRDIYSIIERPGFFLDIEPLPGAVKSLKYLVDAGHKVRVLSASSKYAASDKMEWVEKYLPFLSFKDVILAYSKDWVCGDVLIDDGPHNLTAYQDAWSDSLVVGIKYPYNESLQGRMVEGNPTPIFLADGWNDPEAAWAAILDRIEGFRKRISMEWKVWIETAKPIR